MLCYDERAKRVSYFFCNTMRDREMLGTGAFFCGQYDDDALWVPHSGHKRTDTFFDDLRGLGIERENNKMHEVVVFDQLQSLVPIYAKIVPDAFEVVPQMERKVARLAEPIDSEGYREVCGPDWLEERERDESDERGK